jgi:hypothetical protein
LAAAALVLGLLAPSCGDDGETHPDCSSVCYDIPSTETCACAWECPPEDDVADFEVHCEPSGGVLECTCIEEGEETGSFTSDNFCDVEVPETQANAGCGWHVR